MAARYAVGMELDIYYDPVIPHNAVLFRGNSPMSTLITLAIGPAPGVAVEAL
jgi:hypothetical protein